MKSKLNVSREGFKELLLINPNLFGHFPQLGLPKMSDPAINSSYEELECVSYHPETQELRAVIKMKQPAGYGGNACSEGSFEYVRFFVDYANNGTWTDEGLTVTNLHSLGFKEDLCYGVKLRITPDKRSLCSSAPVLPKVRAILSWNQEPTAGDPDFKPYWGDIREVHIQIAPLKLMKKTAFDLFPAISKVPKLSSLLQHTSLLTDADGKENISLGTLLKAYDKTVDHNRSAFSAVHKIVSQQSAIKMSSFKSLAAYKINTEAVLDFIKNSKFNTQFEELTCVALNRELNELHGVIHVTRSSGYMGGLCTKGSREYIAFYMDFGSGWEFMGTTSVSVHDIPAIPKDGLWYNAFLGIDLLPHQKAACVAGLAKVRGILSWNAVPPANNPDYVAPWGDWEECYVEVKPLPEGFDPLKPKPLLESLGGIQITAIDQTSGLASGQSTFIPAINADDSPFDGSIVLAGMLPFAPEGELYEIHVKYPGSDSFVKWNGPFSVHVMSWNSVTGMYEGNTILQSPDSDNRFIYRNNFTPANFKKVVGDVMGVISSTFEGKHQVKIVRPLVANPSLRESATVTFFVEKSNVDVNIFLNNPVPSGDDHCKDCECGDFVAGQLITGTFNWSGNYFGAVSLSLLPSCSANHAPVFQQMLSDGNPQNDSVIAYPLSITDNNWSLDTTDMCQCGYVVRIEGRNRTIMHSSYIGKYDTDSVGFCLRKNS
ncbi:MAG: hypothetical protein MUC87_08770 [Bacteroidia bacterium]|jgi:hypothetical protein|nr:hypothetical protein [Bacteroidia bacterium]